jgi:hypothetical protein
VSINDVVARYRRDREYEIAVASERQRDHLIEVLGKQAYEASRGANVLEEMAASVDDLSSDLARVAAVADWALPAIVEHLALTAERVGGMEQMLANPSETAAAELYRRGCFALQSGWTEEAESDLHAAVQQFPYNPKSWFNLGVARQRKGAVIAATDAYRSCARYGLRLDKGLAATAVLMVAFIYRDAGDSESSLRILSEYAQGLASCAELDLALGVHHEQFDSLVRALVLDPGLAADARVGGASRLDAAATDAGNSPEGPFTKLRLLRQIASDLIQEVNGAGIDVGRSVSDPLPAFETGADSLLAALNALPEAVSNVALIVGAIEAEVDRRTSACQSAVDRLAQARDDMIAAEQRARSLEDCAPKFCSALMSSVAAIVESERIWLERDEEAEKTTRWWENHLAEHRAEDQAQEAREYHAWNQTMESYRRQYEEELGALMPKRDELWKRQQELGVQMDQVRQRVTDRIDKYYEEERKKPPRYSIFGLEPLPDYKPTLTKAIVSDPEWASVAGETTEIARKLSKLDGQERVIRSSEVVGTFVSRHRAWEDSEDGIHARGSVTESLSRFDSEKKSAINRRAKAVQETDRTWALIGDFARELHGVEDGSKLATDSRDRLDAISPETDDMSVIFNRELSSLLCVGAKSQLEELYEQVQRFELEKQIASQSVQSAKTLLLDALSVRTTAYSVIEEKPRVRPFVFREI